MQIIAALYVEEIGLRQVAGDSTRIDLTGVHFSVPVEQFPTTLRPHLVVLVRCPSDHPGTATLEVVFKRSGEEVARNVQPFLVEPGRFGYRLVKGELEFSEPSTVEAHCTLQESDQTLVVPLTAVQA